MAFVVVNGARIPAMYLAPGYIRHVSGAFAEVPGNESWEVLGARAEVTTSEASGNRSFALTVKAPDSDSVAFASDHTPNLAASKKDQIREVQGVTGCYASPGSKVEFLDTAAIDPKGDKVSAVITVRVHPIPEPS